MVKKIPVKQITSWSFSRYGDYRQCPLKAKLKHLDKIQEPPNDAMARGAAIHDMAEGYIKGKISRMPAELKRFDKLFRELRKQYKKKINGMVVEDMWAFDRKWNETAWNDWANCWVRIKLDCASHDDEVTLRIRDWKTGKFRDEMNEDYVEQLELYALAALILHDHIERVIPELVYLDQGSIYPPEGEEMVFTRDDIPKLKKKWEQRVKAMVNDKKFAPRPNDKCRWCFYRAANKDAGGGQCKF